MKKINFTYQTNISSQNHFLFKNLPHHHPHHHQQKMYFKHFNQSTNLLNTYDVYAEARCLLNEWMIKNTLNNENFENATDDDYEPISITPSRKEIKREWDHLYQINNWGNDFTDDDYEVKSMHYLEHDSKTTNSHHSDYSSKRHSTLDKILLRQEEAKARRELRQKELESRRLREANDRQMKAQILYKAKQDEKLRQAEEKREEELIHQEMVRVRKELELEKQASIKNK
ncbi:unnamed protein product [Schistosoma turkestanicum]|nr:unnamed protein product [Schistosoma turkestanicum]